MAAGTFGHFAGPGAEYVVTTPDTPATWFNYLFNDEYDLRVSQTGQGASRAHQPTLNVWNRGFRYFYITDAETGSTWNATHVPLCEPLDEYTCTHGLGRTTFAAKRDGLRVETTVFVPRRGRHEVWQLTLTNEADAPKDVRLHSVFSFDSVAHMGKRCFYDANRRVLADAFPHHAAYEDYERLRDRPNHAWVWVSEEPAGWACGEPEFFGRDHHHGLPRAIADGAMPNRDACMGDPMAGYEHRMALAPGASESIVFAAGCGEGTAEAAGICLRYGTPGAIEAALAEVDAWWRAFCGHCRIETPDADLDRFVNYYWPKEIAWMTRLWRGGISTPWRNELQDAMGYALLDPAGARPFLREVVARQRSDGYLKVWNTRAGHAADHPLTQKRHTDGGIWLTICLCSYIQQTGGIDAMAELVPFEDGGEADLYEHLCRAVRFSGADRGLHGLVLMHDGDWTDPINGPGRGGRGESVWASEALCYAISQLLPLCEARGDADRAEAFTELADELADAVNTHAWAGEWYAYGFDDEGGLFGTADEEEGQLFLNTQSWAILSGVATGERLVKCIQAVETLQTPAGPLLLTPAFTKWNPTVGRLSLKVPGTTENASIYCHGSAFLCYAQALLGDAASAIEGLGRLLPTNPDNPPERNGQIPIFQANSYFGTVGSPEFGRSSHTLGTGTCTWALLTAVEGVLGLERTIEGLRIEPNLPADWPGAKVTRPFRGCTYAVTIERDAEHPEGEQVVEVDGQAIEGLLLPYEPGRSYEVAVRIGSRAQPG